MNFGGRKRGRAFTHFNFTQRRGESSGRASSVTNWRTVILILAFLVFGRLATKSGGLATFQTSALSLGSHTITEVYSGDTNFTTSTSSGFPQAVNPDATTTALGARPNVSKPGQLVTFTATVAVIAPATGIVTGTVTFKDGPKMLGSGALSGGKATFTTSALTTGSHAITASYGGSTTLAASSGGVAIAVDPRVGSEFRVNTYTAGSQQLPAIAGLVGNGFVAVWQSNAQDGSGLGIYGQRYTSAGAKSGSEVRVNTKTAGDQSMPAVAGLKDGGYVVAWQSSTQDGSGLGLYAQHYSKTGAKIGVEFRVTSTVADDQSQPAVAAFTGGSFVVVWTSVGQDGSLEGIYGQRFTTAPTH